MNAAGLRIVPQLFSATVPPWVMSTAAVYLKDPVRVEVDREEDVPVEIEHTVYDMEPSAKLAPGFAVVEVHGVARHA